MAQSFPRRSGGQTSGPNDFVKREIILCDVCLYRQYRCIYLLIFVDFDYFLMVYFLFQWNLLVTVALLCGRLAHRTYCDSTFAQDMISGPHLEYGLLLTECQELCLDNTLRLWQQKTIWNLHAPGTHFSNRAPETRPEPPQKKNNEYSWHNSYHPFQVLC